MLGRKLILGMVVLLVLVVFILAAFLAPMGPSFPGMKGKVGFIGAHTTATLEDSSKSGYMKLRDYLRNHGYEAVQIATSKITPDDLQTYDACVLLAPDTRLAADEIDAIHTYVQKGGGFLICGTGWAQERLAYMNSVASEWGFEFMNTRAYDPEQTTTNYGVTSTQFTVAALGLVEGNPIAERITYAFVLRNSATIKITDPSKVGPAITLSDYAFGEDFDHQDREPNRDHDEPVGREAIIVVNGQLGNGRVVGMGGHDLYSNQWLLESKPAENARSTVYFLDWLTGQ